MGFRVICLFGLPFLPFSILCLVIAKLFLGKNYYIFTISNQYYGHMAMDTEIRLHEAIGTSIIAALRDPKSINIALEEIIRSKINLYPRIVVLPLVAFLRRLPISVARWLGYSNWGQYREFSRYEIFGNQERYLTLTQGQQSQEIKILEKFGLKKKEYFCIAIRDGAFHFGESGQEDESYRNLDFSLFMPMIEGARDSSIKFVRIGRKSKNLYASQNLIDYTRNDLASDLADLVLLKNSLGLINSGDGISAVATVFDIPVLYINHAPWEILCTFSSKNWIVPALFLDRSRGGLATARQIFNYKQLGLTSSAYTLRGLEIIQPNSDEIQNYCQEFITSLLESKDEKSESISSSKEITAVDQFWSSYQSKLPGYAKLFHKDIKAKIPMQFLTDYSKKLFD